MQIDDQLMQMQLKGRLRAFRTHRIDSSGDASQAPGVRRLMAVREEAERVMLDREALHSCIEQIQSGALAIQTEVDRRLDEVASLAVELGLAVAREVVGAVLDGGLADPTPTVRRCLEQVVSGSSDGTEKLTVYLAAEDIGALVTRLQNDAFLAARSDSLDLQVDATLDRGSVRIESKHGRLLYDPIEVLGRVADAVRQQMTSDQPEITHGAT